MTIFKGSFRSIKEHNGENEYLLKYLSEIDLKDFSNWKYEGWNYVEEYKPNHPKYNPKLRNCGRHNDTLFFKFYSIDVNGITLWANVKQRCDVSIEALYTIESKAPKKIRKDEYRPKETKKEH